MKFIMFHGLPGSGKSTRAIAEYPHAVRVNRDDIRTEVAGVEYHSGKPDPKVEDRVTTIQRARIADALSKGLDVVCDDTNLRLQNIKPLLEMVYATGAEVEHVMVDTPIDVCKQRNAARGAAGGREVPEYVIDKMARQAFSADGQTMRSFNSRIGKDKDGQSAVFVWKGRDNANEYEVALREFNESLPKGEPRKAVIFDMDGTLVDVSELVTKYIRVPKRNFHAFHTGSEFSPAHDWVVEAAQRCAREGYAVVVVTARQSAYVGPSSRWLVANNVPVTKLYMRGHDDMRPDYEAKRDIVAQVEADGYTIVHAYDDNPQVLRLWAELGISTTVVPNEQWG